MPIRMLKNQERHYYTCAARPEKIQNQGLRVLVMQQTCRGPFSVVSKTMFPSKRSFCRICFSIYKFCKFMLHRFTLNIDRIFALFCKNSLEIPSLQHFNGFSLKSAIFRRDSNEILSTLREVPDCCR